MLLVSDRHSMLRRCGLICLLILSPLSACGEGKGSKSHENPGPNPNPGPGPGPDPTPIVVDCIRYGSSSELTELQTGFIPLAESILFRSNPTSAKQILAQARGGKLRCSAGDAR